MFDAYLPLPFLISTAQKVHWLVAYLRYSYIFFPHVIWEVSVLFLVCLLGTFIYNQMGWQMIQLKKAIFWLIWSIAIFFKTNSFAVLLYTDRQSPTDLWSGLWFFNFTWFESDMHSVEITLGTVNIDLLLGYWYALWYSLLMLGGGNERWQWEVASRGPWDPEGEEPIHLRPFCSHKAILFFTFCMVFNKWHELVNILS